MMTINILTLLKLSYKKALVQEKKSQFGYLRKSYLKYNLITFRHINLLKLTLCQNFICLICMKKIARLKHIEPFFFGVVINHF